jgi:hypothetical protein
VFGGEFELVEGSTYVCSLKGILDVLYLRPVVADSLVNLRLMTQALLVLEPFGHGLVELFYFFTFSDHFFNPALQRLTKGIRLFENVFFQLSPLMAFLMSA